MYQSNQSFNILPGHLMPFPACERGNLINLVGGGGEFDCKPQFHVQSRTDS